MVSTDPIGDMLTRIRNAVAVRQTEVSMPYSKLKQAVAEILASNKYIVSNSVQGEGITKSLVIQIANENRTSPLTEISRVSKPGRRIYVKVKDIPVIKQGRGMVIISTSKGIMTGNEAKKLKLGGEILCQIY